MNKIILTGNICKDIETKYYNDKKYIKNTIAVRRDYKNKEGNYDSDFLNFTIWGAQAEFVEKFAHKGDKIMICGKLLNNNYEKDGQMVYSHDIQVENIELLFTKQERNEDAELPFDDDIIEVVEEKADDNLLD